MSGVSSEFFSYEPLVQEIGEDVISSRIDQISQEMSVFIEKFQLSSFVRIDRLSLQTAVFDYFSDVKRLKDYSAIERINDYKIKAYESYWLLRRKPLQFTSDLENDRWLYVNEKFVLARLASFLLHDDPNVPMIGERASDYKGMMDTMLYYFKYRRVDPQALELILLAFKTGKSVGMPDSMFVTDED